MKATLQKGGYMEPTEPPLDPPLDHVVTRWRHSEYVEVSRNDLLFPLYSCHLQTFRSS